MKKGELQQLLSACRAEAQVDPQAAFLMLAKLNNRMDRALNRISETDFQLAERDPSRAVVRLEQQSQAFAAGNLIL